MVTFGCLVLFAYVLLMVVNTNPNTSWYHQENLFSGDFVQVIWIFYLLLVVGFS